MTRLMASNHALVLLIAACFAFVVLGSVLGGESDLLGDTNTLAFQPRPLPSAYTPHAKIAINSNAGLAAFPDKTGNGTLSNPYIISNFEIDAGYVGTAISVANTDAYLIIQHCAVSRSDYATGRGISIVDCSNIVITGNNLTEHHLGIALESCHDIIVSNNSISYYTHYDIYVSYSTNCTIQNNNLWAGNSACIYLGVVFSSIVRGNVARGSGYGIKLDYCQNNSFIENDIVIGDGISSTAGRGQRFHGNNITATYGGGAFLSSEINASWTSNRFTNCSIEFASGSLAHKYYDTHSIDPSNLINGRPIYYFVNETGLAEGDYPNAGQIFLINCSSSSIVSVTVSNCPSGLYLIFCTSIEIIQSTFSQNSDGIILRYSSFCRMSGNSITNGGNGVQLIRCRNCTISRNAISFNNRGIYMQYCNYSLIVGNDIWNNTQYQSESEDGLGNRWNNVSYGNYYGDYQDRYPNATNDETTWNTPYVIPGYTLQGYGHSETDTKPMVWPFSYAGPRLNSPSDITYVHGDTNNFISWHVIDDTTSNPTFVVYDNGSLFKSGLWTSGVSVLVNVDGLSMGTHNITIVFDDGQGHVACDMLYVSVLNKNPMVSLQLDLTVVQGSTGNAVSWMLMDETTAMTNFTISRDGVEIARGIWISGVRIYTSINELLPGSYVFTLTALDGLGGIVQDTVIVTVKSGMSGIETFVIILIVGVLIGFTAALLSIIYRVKYKNKKRNKAIR